MERGQDSRVGPTTTRGQATVVGAVLVLGMVVAGTAVVVTLGATALGDTQGSSQLERAQNSMTLFNSRTSMVALGSSPSQTVSFGNGDGTIETDPDAGWIRVTHGNFSTNGDDETIFNKSLGAVIYNSSDREIAYQGGGVWQKGDGEAQMVSPPEFHYRGNTLTLPLVRVVNSDRGTGGSTARISRARDTRRVFPNTSEEVDYDGVDEIGAPYNVTEDDYTNPVSNGTVNVTVQSKYYEGWAEYFRQRTEGTVTVQDSKNRVQVELVSLSGNVGDFEMPQEGNALSVEGMGNNHPISNYKLTLKADSGGGKGKGSGKSFNNMHWSFYQDDPSEQFELHFFSGGKCDQIRDGKKDFGVSIYYYNSSGSPTFHGEWQNQSINTGSNEDIQFDCSNDEVAVNISGDTKMEYGDISLTGSTNKWKLGDDIDSRDVPSETKSFNTTRHDQDYGQFDTGDEETLNFTSNHYLEMLGPGFDLEVTDGPGGSSRIDEGESSGTLDFKTATGTKYITYLHITENQVNVTYD